MAITYPRELPSYRMAECWFDLIDNVAFSPSGNGTFINLSQVNEPLWKGNFVTGLLEREVQPVWSAWKKSLRGGFKLFVAYDVRRKTPYAYPSAKVSTDILAGWNGTAAVSALGLSGALGLTGLPANYQFKAGDRIGLEQSGHYGYYEVIEDIAASGAGAVTVSVTPFLHTGLFTTAAVARIWQAKCQFMLDQSSWSEEGTTEITPVSFIGMQRL